MTTNNVEQKTKTVNLTVPIIFVLAVGAAFLLGFSWKNLKSDQSTPEAQVAVEKPAEGGTAVPESVVLGESDWLDIQTNGAAVKGNQDAPVTIVEFSEYQCPFCSRYAEDAYAKIWEKYSDQIYYVFHDFPLPFHQYAQKAAEAARCAGDQDQYWEMHDLLFGQQDQWTQAKDVDVALADVAIKLGLKQGQFDQCLADGQYKSIVEADRVLGEKVGVTGTPTFFINGKQLVGAQPFEAFAALIDPEL